MSDENSWKTQNFLSLGLVVFGGALFLHQFQRSSSPSSSSPSSSEVENVPLLEALEKAVKRDSIEFFFKNDEEKKLGLVNHEPLTIVALAKLWDKNQTIPEDILVSFHEDYEEFLDSFNCLLSSPRSSFSSLPLSEENDEDFYKWVSTKRGEGTKAIDEMVPIIISRLKTQGVKNTIFQFLKQFGDERGLLASLFHGFLLVSYSFSLVNDDFSSSSSSSSSAPLIMIGTGLAAMVGRIALKGNSLFDHFDNSSNPLDEKRNLQQKLDDLLADKRGDALWDIISPLLVSPIYPFGLVGCLGLLEENEEAKKIWKEIFSEHLSGAKIEAPFEELAEVALNYFVKTRGCFLALHMVSAVFGLCRFHLDNNNNNKENDNNNNNNVILDIGRRLFHVIGLVVWVAERGAVSQEVTVWDRARGKNKPALDELELIVSSKDDFLDWENISQQAIMTLRSHTIKMVFASLSLSEMFPKNKKIGNLAKVAAFIACLHAIG